MERRELPDDVLRSLKEDIPQRGDIADGWQYEDLPRIMPKLSQRFQEKLERIEQRAKENTVPTQRRELKDKTLRRFLGTLPCTSQAEVNLLSDRMAEMTEQDETILSAMIEQHDPRTAERVLELMDDMKTVRCLQASATIKLWENTALRRRPTCRGSFANTLIWKRWGSTIRRNTPALSSGTTTCSSRRCHRGWR